MSRLARAVPALALTGAGALVAVACSGPASGPAVPSPSGAAAGHCRQLAGALPQRVNGQERVPASPTSPYTAVWGDPGIALRCGVDRPELLTPGSEHYNPTADAVVVNDVEWLLERREDGYRFTTIGREAFVEVTVPTAYAPEVNALPELAGPLRRSVPAER
ncbi:DUF3515 domain-containing protein [Streptomyces sp. JJ66]|uniref:DUF3515 domain-containing protein n=1 Tax=Streptomyces sp. JJ66 TaxID=2803843 RepID=UPI001C5709EC|nr:DUF3515 domain-containing protein [Streptomyces sp. JJ66]MBW1601299.1 DUF3515 domain-containing protein [Streptomyces sp. JJ66]